MHKILHYAFVTLLQIKQSAGAQAYKDNWLQIYIFQDSVIIVVMQTY